MSLVAYDSSDDNSEDEEIKSVENDTEKNSVENRDNQTHSKLYLPLPKHDPKRNDATEVSTSDESIEKLHFNLPKPKSLNCNENIVEEDDIPPKKEFELQFEKPIKKDRAPVKITVPSLLEFKDLEEETEKRQSKIMQSKKGTGLFALLPPPKTTEGKVIKTLIPSAVAKASEKLNEQKVKPIKETETKATNISPSKSTESSANKTLLNIIHYESNSEDEEDVSSAKESSTDFFALSNNESDKLDRLDVASASNSIGVNLDVPELLSSSSSNNSDNEDSRSNTNSPKPCKTLISNVMNLPKEEILLKNKAEVGPKLPVPEQEYNVDNEGNVAFDEKAIEYLCGKRGVKRKNKEIDQANIIEISGEDIKPDEREWLVKALTEDPIERPISMQSYGVNSQSKKKHQITYLAHQAKAMEMELKNQWAQNRMTRKQTQSKYGF